MKTIILSALLLCSTTQDVVNLHNEIRSKHKIAELKVDDDLCKIAQKHAEWMFKNKTLQHSKLAGVDYGENICRGCNTPEDAMDMWMNSAGHRANILDKRYKRIGVGFYNGWWCVIFTLH